MKTCYAIVCLALSACGYSSKQNELVGQVKKVVKKTPIVCGDYAEADISLGIVRNGVGSLSKEDVIFYVENPADIALLEKASADGDIVKVSYDVKRNTFCVPDHWITHAEIAIDAASGGKK